MPLLVILGALFAFVILGWVLVTIWIWERVERAAARASANANSRYDGFDRLTP